MYRFSILLKFISPSSSLPHLGRTRLQVLGMRKLLECFSGELGRGITNRIAQRLINLKEPAIERHQSHAGSRVLKCAGKPFFTEPERVFAFFALSRINIDADDVCHLTGVVQNHPLGGQDVSNGSVRKLNAEFRRALRFRGDHELQNGGRRRQILRHDCIGPDLIIHLQILWECRKAHTFFRPT